MSLQSKLQSVSVFFPCYNDGIIISSMVILSRQVLEDIAQDYEIIIVDDGSDDATLEILNALKDVFTDLKIIYHGRNLGYGAVLRRGFKEATKKFIFYTDGDGQYDVRELKKLALLMDDGADVVNGFKLKRHDPLYRVILGGIYNFTVKIMFGLKINDVDCDFRLMRAEIFKEIALESHSGVICVEMIKKIQDVGFKFAQVGVNHYFRAHGKSQFFNFRRLAKIFFDIIALWYKLVVTKPIKKREIACS